MSQGGGGSGPRKSESTAPFPGRQQAGWNRIRPRREADARACQRRSRLVPGLRRDATQDRLLLRGRSTRRRGARTATAAIRQRVIRSKCRRRAALSVRPVQRGLASCSRSSIRAAVLADGEAHAAVPAGPQTLRAVPFLAARLPPARVRVALDVTPRKGRRCRPRAAPGVAGAQPLLAPARLTRSGRPHRAAVVHRLEAVEVHEQMATRACPPGARPGSAQLLQKTVRLEAVSGLETRRGERWIRSAALGHVNATPPFPRPRPHSRRARRAPQVRPCPGRRTPPPRRARHCGARSRGVLVLGGRSRLQAHSASVPAPRAGAGSGRTPIDDVTRSAVLDLQEEAGSEHAQHRLRVPPQGRRGRGGRARRALFHGRGFGTRGLRWRERPRQRGHGLGDVPRRLHVDLRRFGIRKSPGCPRTRDPRHPVEGRGGIPGNSPVQMRG